MIYDHKDDVYYLLKRYCDNRVDLIFRGIEYRVEECEQYGFSFHWEEGELTGAARDDILRYLLTDRFHVNKRRVNFHNTMKDFKSCE